MLRNLSYHVIITSNGNSSRVTTARRGYKYTKKGGQKRGRKKIPAYWREFDHNPAKIPQAWIPPNWENENIVNYEREKILEKYIPGYQGKREPYEHPDFKKNSAYHITESTKLVEGLDQAMAVTKSILMGTKLPSKINDIAEDYKTKVEDEKVINIFRHALMMDIDPRTRIKDKYSNYTYRYPKETSDNFLLYSKPDRYVPLIMFNMRQLCHKVSGIYRSQSIFAQDMSIQSFFSRKCDTWSLIGTGDQYEINTNFNFLLTGKPNLQILSKCPLKPFAGKSEVQKSTNINVTNIYPMLPVTDLEVTNIYKDVNDTGISHDFKYPHLHTMFLYNTDGTPSNEMYGKMTTNLFTALYVRALAKYGRNAAELEEPVVGQCIASDGQYYLFLTMQLNTLDMSDTGVKNMVWIDSPNPEDLPEIPEVTARHRSIPYDELRKYKLPDHIRRFQVEREHKYLGNPMYAACSHRLWQYPGYYKDYNSRVFNLFLAMYLNGNCL